MRGGGVGGRMLALGCVIGAPVLFAAALAPWIAPYGPLETPGPPGHPSPPCVENFLGTDPLGRDVLSVILHGMRASLLLGSTAALAVLAVGLTIGVVAGMAPPWVDALLMRMTDVALALPGVLVAIALASLLEPGLSTLILAIGALGWTTSARIVRQETRALSAREDHEAARALGAGWWHIVRRHLLPALVPVLTTLGATAVANALLLESGLSFLGLGIPPPQPSLGRMLAEGAAFQASAPWLIVFPGLAILVMVLAPSLVANGLLAAGSTARR